MTASPSSHNADPTIDAVAKCVIAHSAPEELSHYEHVRDDFRARGSAPRADDNPLGFGGVAVGLVTGVVLSVLTELAAGTLTDILRPWWQRAWSALLSRVGLSRTPKPDTDTMLTPVRPEQTAAVTRAITAHAVRSGIEAEQAGKLAAAIVRELGRSTDHDDTSFER
ncbi:hypothetical protein F4561_006353 [Lipingzhangella halophila]|uniref:Uncharacterized protein n=1 Tax=Lipingzhangella halophila TaxID=1783352 RepID=A0A7W7W6Z0_9ACTN|nr:hypothetical protein [Lipingzhangella halophila]MBB4935459.1 hypothetical protein [Lipingzhangella halophila]